METSPRTPTPRTLAPDIGNSAVYDALGQVVEQQSGGSYTEILYSPVGKTALMNGSTLSSAFLSLPGGGTAVYTSSGLAYYRHADWLGSSRLASTPSQTLYSSTAYAPFGQPYATAGTSDQSFTGQNSDTVSSLYDFPARRLNPSMGRWISPDPSGMSAVDPTNPQTWNRYAYVANNPLSFVDPLGLDQAAPCWTQDQNGNWYSYTCDDDGASTGGAISGGNGGYVNASDGWSPYYGDRPNINATTPYISGSASSVASNSLGHIAGCFARGAVVGAAGAVAVGVLWTAAVALGAPVAAVTITLGAAAAIGTGVAVLTTGVDVYQGNYAGAAYGAGSLLGGLAAGAGRAANTVRGLTGSSGTPLGASEAGLGMYREPGQSWWQSFVAANGKGPTQNSAAVATGVAGTGLSGVFNWLGGAGCH